MSMPFYVAPEQLMKDKADYARKGIARGRSLVAMVFDGGILLAAENPSRTLHKVSEIYDRIAFAGVGKFNEFDQLRQAGVRHADVKGYTYSREDVDARSLANAYAQTIGQVFTHEMKPLEIEILVAELGLVKGQDELYHILYDGTVMDESKFSVLGGEADVIADRLADSYEEEMSLEVALRAAVDALSGDDEDDRLHTDDLEVAILDRGAGRRTFRRLRHTEIAALLGLPDEPGDEGEEEGTATDDGPSSQPVSKPSKKKS
jgi:proteasome alpha subunit